MRSDPLRIFFSRSMYKNSTWSHRGIGISKEKQDLDFLRSLFGWNFKCQRETATTLKKLPKPSFSPFCPQLFFLNKPKPLEVNFEMFDRRAKWSTRAYLKFPRGQTGPALGPRRRAVRTRTGKRDPKKSPPAGARPRVSSFDLAACPPQMQKEKVGGLGCVISTNEHGHFR